MASPRPVVAGSVTVDGVRQYRILIHTVVSGPARAEAGVDILGEFKEQNLTEVAVSVYAELYCERCDQVIAALEPHEIAAPDLVSVLVAHGPACEAAASWDPVRDA